MLAFRQSQARSLYAQLCADLQLQESQIDTLTHLIAEHETLSSGWSTGGVDFTPQQEDQQRAREGLSQIERLLGAAAFRRFTEYQDTLGERFELSRLVQLLIAVDHPLTSDQTAQLVSIMRAERGLRQSPSTTDRDEFDRRIKPRFDAVLRPEQREFAELYFAGRAERRHDTLGFGRAAD
jgi:hypothetical protein